MSNRAAMCTQADVARVLKAGKLAGLGTPIVEVRRDAVLIRFVEETPAERERNSEQAGDIVLDSRHASTAPAIPAETD